MDFFAIGAPNKIDFFYSRNTPEHFYSIEYVIRTIGVFLSAYLHSTII